METLFGGVYVAEATMGYFTSRAAADHRQCAGSLRCVGPSPCPNSCPNLRDYPGTLFQTMVLYS